MLPLKVDPKEVPTLATVVRLRPLEHTLAMVDTRHREPPPHMEDRHHPALSPPTTHPIKEAPHPQLRHQDEGTECTLVETCVHGVVVEFSRNDPGYRKYA